MRKIIYGGLFLAAVGIGFVGCKKDNMNKLERSQNNALEFNSMEELKSKIKELESMNEEDRRIYENQNGYKSLYTQVHEVYEEINMDEVKDRKEVYDHVNRNQNLLEIAKNEDGELEYRPFYSDNPYSLVANGNRMIIVDSICLKVFDDGLISTNAENFDKLKSQESRSVKNTNLNSDFNISHFRSLDASIKSHCGSYKEDIEDDNRDRTKLWVECFYENISGIPYVTGRGQIRPYKKTLGIWYFARRTIEGRIKFDVSYTLNGQTEVYQFNQIIPANLSYTQSKAFNEPLWPNVPSNVRFTSIDSWGDTPSTGTATIICH